MFEAAPEGLMFRPLGVRVRLRSRGPDNALATRLEPYDALDLYFSELRSDFVAGTIKRVANSYKADNVNILASYSVVRSSSGEQQALAAAHRGELLRELRHQYKNALVRFTATNPKNARRMRARLKAATGTDAPEPDTIEPHFASHPEALAKTAGIRDLLDHVTRL